MYIKASKSSPVRFTLRINDTTTDMVQATIGGNLVWIGRPMSATGEEAKVALIIDDECRVPYGPALNFIVDNGVRGAAHRRTKERTDLVRAQIQSAVAYHLAFFYDEARREKDIELLGIDLGAWLSACGYTLIAEPATELDREVFSLLGLNAEIVAILDHYGWTVTPNLDALFNQRVPPSFATVADGAWDAFSASVIVSNNVTYGEAQALQKLGKCFKRTPMRQTAAR